MRSRSRIRILYSSLALTALLAFTGPWLARADERDAELWLERAAEAHRDITNQRYADRAAARLHALYLLAGDVDRANSLSPRIQDAALRLQAHVAIATQYAKDGRKKACVAELKRANEFGQASKPRMELVDAYLDLAKSPQLAVAEFESLQKAKSLKRDALCQSLARRGYLKEAFQVAESEAHYEDRSRLVLLSVLAAAEEGRVEDAERGAEKIEAEVERPDYYKQYVWMALAEALYERRQFDAAKAYAGRVTDKYQKRRNRRALAKIASGAAAKPRKPSGKPSFTGMVPEKLREAIEANDAAAAKRIVEQMIAAQEANPAEPTTGQFGPSNQTIQLAMKRSHYAHVGYIHYQNGDIDKAIEHMKVAEDAIQVLVKENAFAAWLTMLTFQEIQFAIDDVDGLKRIAKNLAPELWARSADRMVKMLLAKGDIEGARLVARRSLAAKDRMGHSGDARTSEISSFVIAGETKVALQLLQSEKLEDLAAGACEKAGIAFLETGQAKLLQSSLAELPAAQRAHVCLGAAEQTLDEPGE